LHVSAALTISLNSILHRRTVKEPKASEKMAVDSTPKDSFMLERSERDKPSSQGSATFANKVIK
jgi:hypothetical protein